MSHREPPLLAPGWSCLGQMKDTTTWCQVQALVCPMWGVQRQTPCQLQPVAGLQLVSLGGSKEMPLARSCSGYIRAQWFSEGQASSTAENSSMKAWHFCSSSAIDSQSNVAMLSKWACCRAAAVSVCYALASVCHTSASASHSSALSSWASF